MAHYQCHFAQAIPLLIFIDIEVCVCVCLSHVVCFADDYIFTVSVLNDNTTQLAYITARQLHPQTTPHPLRVLPRAARQVDNPYQEFFLHAFFDVACLPHRMLWFCSEMRRPLCFQNWLHVWRTLTFQKKVIESEEIKSESLARSVWSESLACSACITNYIPRLDIIYYRDLSSLEGGAPAQTT